jgi:hypothetical protein
VRLLLRPHDVRRSVVARQRLKRRRSGRKRLHTKCGKTRWSGIGVLQRQQRLRGSGRRRWSGNSERL